MPPIARCSNSYCNSELEIIIDLFGRCTYYCANCEMRRNNICPDCRGQLSPFNRRPIRWIRCKTCRDKKTSERMKIYNQQPKRKKADKERKQKTVESELARKKRRVRQKDYYERIKADPVAYHWHKKKRAAYEKNVRDMRKRAAINDNKSSG